MDNRREFIKKAAILTGAAGLGSILPPSIQKALAINPAAGSTWLDAEHVVILMQENRSFDHCYGKLRGVRGYRDPRAIRLADGNPVWLQANAAGETYGPFRLDIQDTNATWMGSLPHSWTDQIDARNEGKYDRWLQAKPSGNQQYGHMPLTMGYYDRRDIPFYYSLADAFTVCDQNFCSSLTGTTPNRLHLWTGTIRDQQKANVRARVRNGDTDYRVEASWTTFPERLEDAGVDWRIYQNELSIYQGFEGEEEGWLANFTDNPIEWFTQYQVRYSPAYMGHLPQLVEKLRKEVAELSAVSPADDTTKRKLARQQALLKFVEKDMETITPENYAKLDQRTKNLHERAFTRNQGDADFLKLDDLNYTDKGTSRTMKAPKGDVFHQFRADVAAGKLPTVSWLVAPANFSDHPGAPWYGAWYVSEAMDILTKNPEVWKKTIFILCYDENDGYFDHVPPFVAPDTSRPETGKVSAGIDAGLEYHSREHDLKRAREKEARGGPVGLGYRVPLVIASPWSRGGFVNSQVCDHTSIIMLLEAFVGHKTGKHIRETNISEWRRAVCGDLTSVFRPYKGERVDLPFLGKEVVLKDINQAQYRDLPTGFRKLTGDEIARARKDGHLWSMLPEQEKGTRPSCALPYELSAEGGLIDGGVRVVMRAGKTLFGNRSAGAPFTVYAYGKEMNVRNYAVKAGDELSDVFSLEDGKYDLHLYGPNGFYRSWIGSKDGPALTTVLEYVSGKLRLVLGGKGTVVVRDNAYGAKVVTMQAGSSLDMSKFTSSGWYDFSVMMDGVERRYAGRVENGKDGISDPAMG
ncbi:MAG: phospholipase C, phosphocholine-specific [Bacteroidetes bacterium]|nr:phospholipase C, phosphocholine-specific [Bacteroidota bacterium]